ncbi:MAG: anaerobic ribonucleoside-triphosphate reductase activating protein [Spirochaetia bacterium]|nr:anaerobic ribonucleoside-triphosphate reductase activating protein [Spirochaetia bacterium]
MNEKIGALVKTSLVDFPGTVCTAVFLKHCSLRCPYCYNAQLVTGKDDAGLSTMEEIKAHLLKRRKILDALTVSGGEPLLNRHTEQIISFAKSLGYKVKLDTNGTLPALLKKITENPQTRPDFLAMDIKTSPKKYRSLLNARNLTDRTDYETVLKESVEILKTYPPEKTEFRTVLVPTLIQEEDIKNIAALLPENARWEFANFLPGNCLEPLYNALPPYTPSETEKLVALAKKLIPGAELR